MVEIKEFSIYGFDVALLQKGAACPMGKRIMLT